MLNWRLRLNQWGEIVRLRHASAPWSHMLLAILSGPVPREVWRARVGRQGCRGCPVHGRVLLRDEKNVLKWVGLHICLKRLDATHTAGCGCNTTFLALTAAPYPKGCWARQISPHEGWPSYPWPSRWAKVRAVLGFFLP